MKLIVSNENKTQDITLGDIVVFEQYGTSYVVHTADSSAVENYGAVKGNAFQLYRLDGEKPYRKAPFTGQGLVELIRFLNGKVYPSSEYTLQLVRK